jgi:hypothetical protein
MIVYREQKRRVATREALRRAEALAGFEREMELGEIEAGVADALCPERDDELPESLPEEIELSVPEGFAYYAVDPELYRIAARRYAAEQRPERVAVIGIRSIGATLGRVVEDELRRLGIAERRWTVRPRGHPFRRELRVAERLERAWREWPGSFAVVDEGPGLSGSSFASVAEWLSGIGVADERIALFPSWEADGATFVNEDARKRWRRHRRYVARFEELGKFADCRELSAGAWREVCGVWPAVQPQHERRKYLGEGRLYKFAGYGRYGREKLERSRRLEGFATPVVTLSDGFLESRWLEARQARLSDELIEFAARYLAAVRREFGSGQAADTAALSRMIEVNCGEGWGAAVPEGEAVALDGRMLAHEWLETRDGFCKADALEHHDDHFFPGPQDIAWDVAAFGVEVGGGDYLVECYRRESGDRGIAARLPFYRTAYLAFRLGYCEMAADATAGTDDAVRFRQARDRYRAALWAAGRESWTTNRSRLSA